MDAMYAGNQSVRQSFIFEKTSGAKAALQCQLRHLIRMPAPFLIVRKIIPLKLRRRSKHLVSVDHGAAVPTRNEFFCVRIGCDNRSATGGQSKNQSPVRSDANDPTTH